MGLYGLMKAQQPTSFSPFSAHSQWKSVINFYLHVKSSLSCSPALDSDQEQHAGWLYKDAGILDRIRGLEVADLEGHLHG